MPPGMKPMELSTAQAYSYEFGSTEEYIFEKLSPEMERKEQEEIKRSLQSFTNLSSGTSHEWYIDDKVERYVLCDLVKSKHD